MNRITNNVLIFLAVLIIIFGYVYVHEVVHKEIYKLNDCESSIHFFQNGMIAYTQPDINCKITPILRLAHSINEIIGYQLGFVIVLILFLIFKEYI